MIPYFNPTLDFPSLLFYKQKWVFLYWPYPEISDAGFKYGYVQDFVDGFQK